MKKYYYELEIAFNEKNYESIYNLLYISGITSIVEDKGLIKVSLDETGFEVLEKIKDELIRNTALSEKDITLAKFNNHDWNKEWERTIEPVYIKDRIIVFPSWKKNHLKNTEGKVLIQIDPKMSFGTGHNETTQLILELMSDHITSRDKYMFDFGCGTAILAIAGVKLGIKRVIAIDIDEDSIENAKENIHINDAQKEIDLYWSDIHAVTENGFDVIAANITSSVIVPNMKMMHSKLKKKGKIFLTGILLEEKDEIAKHLILNNFEVEDVCDKAEWTSFYAIKK